MGILTKARSIIVSAIDPKSNTSTTYEYIMVPRQALAELLRELEANGNADLTRIRYTEPDTERSEITYFYIRDRFRAKTGL